jgi:lipopolysaccharide/colanic/teichoic acid biosynthesis glycosyltransferase
MEIRKFRVITLFADILILAISFMVVVATKPSGFKGYLPSHSILFAGLALIWLAVSLIYGKMHRGKIVNYSSLLYRVIGSNIIAIAITTLLMYTLREYFYSRIVVLGTAGVATLLELLFGTAYLAIKKAKVQDLENYSSYKDIQKKSEYDLVKKVNCNGNGRKAATTAEINPRILNAIESEIGRELAQAILKMTGTRLNNRTAVLSTTTLFNITNLPYEKYDYIVNLHKINDIARLDRFLDEVNSKLRHRGLFLCCVETKDQRKARLLKKFPPVLNYIFYTFDFVAKRVLPKLKFTKRLYHFLNHGSNAVISRAEALGRLSRAGFMINQESFIGHYLCVEAMKIDDPIYINGTTYGPLIALPRVGLNGDLIKVYKLRTMHPYSEFIQEYVYKMHDLKEGGKFRDDFRITSWGAMARRVWLDEFPMFINFFKGNMKLVGVRPLSKHYYELYSKELQELRIKYKPGLIPPFYADMPSDLDEIQASETRYLDSYDKSPVMTDVRYFLKSGKNILFGKARSN